MIKFIINGILGNIVGLASSSIYKLYCKTNKDKLDKLLPTDIMDIFYQCDFEKAINIDNIYKRLNIFRLNKNDKLETSEIRINEINNVEIVEDNNNEGDCKYIRLCISTNLIEYPHIELIFLKPMYLSGNGSFCKDSEVYQNALVNATKCKKLIENSIHSSICN